MFRFELKNKRKENLVRDLTKEKTANIYLKAHLSPVKSQGKP